ncbi:MAG: ATP phosphoribosyltransferase regulatory subunit [Alphaproteobacteria bacterium]|nr:ATP phosphoribosyltransferase regulatory subunit [Alphaproteobacteria bacterium]
MIAAPPYDAATLAALEAQTSALLDVFATYGAERIEPAIVQPADAFLDRMGEDLRRRTYVFTGPDGTELCLRPDLTIPTCQAYLARAPMADRAMKLCYAGPVFRHDPKAPDRPGQSYQAGVENITAANAAAADAEALILTDNALARTGLKNVETTVGDLSIFASLLDALGLSPQWAERLRRHVWRPAYMSELLKRLTGEATSGNAFLAHVGALPADEARAVVRDALAMNGIRHIGTRTMEEITERFLEQAADASSARLPRATADLIAQFLAVKCPATAAVDTLRKLARSASISLDSAIGQLERRLGLIERHGFNLDRATFAAEFGRNMEYYTGFVFELRASAVERPVAGGGRYDNLLTALGAPKPAPAVGLAIFAERLLAARRAQGVTA